MKGLVKNEVIKRKIVLNGLYCMCVCMRYTHNLNVTNKMLLLYTWPFIVLVNIFLSTKLFSS